MGTLAHPLRFALSVLRKIIYSYHQVNPSAHSIPLVICYFYAHLPGRKLLHSIFQTDDSRFWIRINTCTYLQIAATTLNLLSRKIRNLLFILFIIARFLYVLISQVPESPSRAIIMDPFTRRFTTINTYFCVLRQYSTYSRRRGSVGYPHQDSI